MSPKAQSSPLGCGGESLTPMTGEGRPSEQTSNRETDCEPRCTLTTEITHSQRREEVMMMELLPEALRKQLPPLYSTEQKKDPMVWCKFFFPDFGWRWYALEFDGTDL